MFPSASRNGESLGMRNSPVGRRLGGYSTPPRKRSREIFGDSRHEREQFMMCSIRNAASQNPFLLRLLRWTRTQEADKVMNNPSELEGQEREFTSRMCNASGLFLLICSNAHGQSYDDALRSSAPKAETQISKAIRYRAWKCKGPCNSRAA